MMSRCSPIAATSLQIVDLKFRLMTSSRFITLRFINHRNNYYDMTIKNQKRNEYELIAEYYRKINGNIEDLDVLLKTPSDQWDDSKTLQVIFQTGSILNGEISDENIAKCMRQLDKLIVSHSLPYWRMNNIMWILSDHWDSVPQQLHDDIENILSRMIRELIYQSVSDLSLLSTTMRSNREMLERIVKSCPKEWFSTHTVKETNERVPGIYRAGNEELFDFIGNVRGIKWKTRQTVTIEDVLDINNNSNPRARSHRGYAVNIICNSREKFVPRHFAYGVEKIEIDRVKGHKTPDWVVRDSSNNSLCTVECYAGSDGSLKNGVREAIRHGDSKEIGRKYYGEMLGLSDSTLRIAAYVYSVPIKANCDIQLLEEMVRCIIPMKTSMDGLLLIIASESTYETTAVYFDISHRDAGFLFDSNVVIYSTA